MTGTTERVLQLLSLLQSRPVWSGAELAERLGVTTRSIRRDAGRLRSLGYPVEATHGSGGGYRLGAGRALPPLLLADEEAVAVAVSLRLAAGGTVAGASEAAVRTLAKLDQVMPPRLRSEVRAITDATATLVATTDQVDGELLLRTARACRDQVRLRFGYRAGDGTTSERRVEPLRLVATSRRWYLAAWDLDRDDWRTFRLDRMSEVEATTWRFVLRQHPDPVELVQRSVTAAPYRFVAVVRLHAPLAVVADQVSAQTGRLEADGEDHCVLTAGGDDLGGITGFLLSLGHELDVLEPEELREAFRASAGRMLRAVQPRG
ncbi:Predicted DNA-binding transcriptional regulator YafY, contains an HTH and WYL domains [Nocardioides scoriae]|uniref:Predicted DNA-binding transcriptional regulator YafY, contains an HTH and WYL domains n=1 Tax=Nocardioides scoriae TaxID=642780 RepID=A0A1H1Y0T4_9ACTN|nr:YafY family protein [Nocardioides scoriae]SDT15078.1 Predicted DNA-binding transcriptional regulator YafY, contains an HTH and WYL domains [Nocardioides scoriae]